MSVIRELAARQLAAYNASDLDAFHGMERDADLAATRMGVRHVMQADGNWLQPEPLLRLGPLPEQMLAPRSMLL